MDDESLIHCLEYCTQYFKDKEGSNLLELWYLIGMQGPGILYDDLKEILCQEEASGGLPSNGSDLMSVLSLDYHESSKEHNYLSDAYPHHAVDWRSKKAVDNFKCRCKAECHKIAQLTKNLEDLLQFSLIEQEALDKAGTIKRYRVSPFVD